MFVDAFDYEDDRFLLDVEFDDVLTPKESEEETLEDVLKEFGL